MSSVALSKGPAAALAQNQSQKCSVLDVQSLGKCTELQHRQVGTALLKGRITGLCVDKIASVTHQLVFKIVRRAIGLSHFRYSYHFLTHFSSWWPIFNGRCSSHFSFKYYSQLWPVLVCRSWKVGLGKVEEPSDTVWRVRSLVPALHKIIWWTLLRLKVITTQVHRLQEF